MIEHFDAQGDRANLIADVCIVGGGASGVTLADALVAEGREVLLLESGGIDHDPAVQSLMQGASHGFPYYDLADCRLRFFGGTTAIWGGRCAQLNEIDFQRRAWVPHSGWPIGKADLAPHYARAQGLLGLPPTNGEDELWDAHGLTPPPWSPDVIGSAFWQFDQESDRFAVRQPARIKASRRARILLHASVTGIRLNPQGSAVVALDFANLAGGRGRVRARQFVLAAGGIENARILLASDDVRPNGVGNDHDLVGRFFMEHPHARGARIETSAVMRLMKALPRSYSRGGIRHAAVARPAPALQRREGLLNSAFTLAARQHPGARMVMAKRLFLSLRDTLDPDQRNRRWWNLYRRQVIRLREHAGPLLAWASIRGGGYGLYTVLRAEQAPNPQSRVTLGPARDALGMRQVALDWRMSAIDKHTARATMQALDGELARLGLGRCILEPWLADDGPDWQTDPLISNHPIGGFHHIGTTRMAASPRAGVVDADCKVHGIANLWIAGSSVFPTSGWANPTLTILALALRLADHLGQSVARTLRIAS